MAKTIVSTSCTLIWMCIIVFAKGQTTIPNSFDSTSNRTEEVSNNISVPTIGNETLVLVANHTDTYDFIGNLSDNISDIFNRTGVVAQDVANRTKDFFNNVSNDTNKTKNCLIVVGIALAGGLIAPLAICIGIPLILCLLGFTCWGIMAGSAAACCQSSIGDVPSGSCFSCLQSTGAGGGSAYIIFACIVGVPIGLGLGGYVAETYFHCFSDS